MKHVALVGFMAAGKTTLGKRLARMLALPFVDTDAMVEAVHGAIPDIFASEGEAVFREYEFQALYGALAGPPSIIAVGGGAVTHPPTLALLERHTYRIFLAVKPATVVHRVRASGDVRPLLGSDPQLEKVEELYRARLPLYQQSDFTVEADTKGAAIVCAEIVAWLAAHEPMLVP